MHAIMGAHGWQVVGTQGIQYAHGVGFLSQSATSVSLAQWKADASSVVARFPPVTLQRKTKTTMPRVIFVNAGECNRFDVEPGLLADLAAQAFVDGLAEF
jgi:hypothetical protein